MILGYSYSFYYLKVTRKSLESANILIKVKEEQLNRAGFKGQWWKRKNVFSTCTLLGSIRETVNKKNKKKVNYFSTSPQEGSISKGKVLPRIKVEFEVG